MREERNRENFLRFRSPVSVGRIYKLNMWELWLLSSLEHLLSSTRRQVISRKVLFDHLTNNVRKRAKFLGYYEGLINKGMLGTYEYISNPGSLSIGITDLGMKVLDEYHRYGDELNEQYPIVTDNVRVMSVEQVAPPRYIKRSA